MKIDIETVVYLSGRSYEIPLLMALDKLGGSARVPDVFPVVKKIMELERDYPGELDYYPTGNDLIWQNKTRWARHRLKAKGELDGSVRGVWKITDKGRDRLSSRGLLAIENK